MQEFTLLLQYHNKKCNLILKDVGMIRRGEENETSFEEGCSRAILSSHYKLADCQINQTTGKMLIFWRQVLDSRN